MDDYLFGEMNMTELKDKIFENIEEDQKEILQK